MNLSLRNNGNINWPKDQTYRVDVALRQPNEPEVALSDKVWSRWLKHDPVEMLGSYADNLKQVKLLFVDVGKRDEFNLQLGARIFHQRLNTSKVKHRYEEFDNGHRGIAYRYETSLSLLSKVLG